MGSEHKNFVIISDYLEHGRTRLHFLIQDLDKRFTRALIEQETCIFCSTVFGFYYKADTAHRSTNQLRY